MNKMELKMTRLFLCASISALICTGAIAGKYDSRFRGEIKSGLSRAPVVTSDETAVRDYDEYIQTEREVFYDECAQDIEYDIFTPTTMYVRMGGGINIPPLTTRGRIGNDKYSTRDSWNVSIGAGLNLSSYVRTELVFQQSSFRFNDVPELTADYHTLNGMLYFDMLRRYVNVGDITYRRTFVPFIGFGGGIGWYDFAGTGGAGGMVVPAPRAELGMNIMLNDLIGIDIAYQYQMLIGHGFGWNTTRQNFDNIGNVMLTIRANF